MRPDFTVAERANTHARCNARPTAGMPYYCSRAIGHADYHAAGTGELIVATWDDGQAVADLH